MLKNMTAREAQRTLKKLAISKKRAKFLAGFFKTGKGQYAEGDIFFGVTVPQTRRVASQFNDLSLSEIRKLLNSKVHEVRLMALLILVHQFQQGSAVARARIAKFYLKNTTHVNNWDLVDLSADKILGEWLHSHILKNVRMKVLVQLARSKNLWERRIAMISTYAFIKCGECVEALKIAKILLNDQQDLIHKAVGWMLREVGKRCSRAQEEKFLKKHCRSMPRTMLRYALEHFPLEFKEKYLKVLTNSGIS